MIERSKMMSEVFFIHLQFHLRALRLLLKENDNYFVFSGEYVCIKRDQCI